MPGVTKDTIKVVVYTGIPADQTPEDAAARGMGQLAVNLSTGLPGTIENAMHDTTAAVGHPLETWGRTIEYEYMSRTGEDETAQRADAVVGDREEAVRGARPRFGRGVLQRGRRAQGHRDLRHRHRTSRWTRRSRTATPRSSTTGRM